MQPLMNGGEVTPIAHLQPGMKKQDIVCIVVQVRKSIFHIMAAR
jgi:hypothetical protein